MRAVKLLPARLLTLLVALYVAQPVSAFYNPDIGRWLSRDPIGEAGGINLYGYVGNDPVNQLDNFGLSKEDEKRILESYARSTEWMNRNGHRVDIFPPFGSVKWPGYGLGGKGWECISQSQKVANDLNRLTLDDPWVIQVIMTPSHTWVEAAPSCNSPNHSKDSIMILDPWWGFTRQLPYRFITDSAISSNYNSKVNRITGTLKLPSMLDASGWLKK